MTGSGRLSLRSRLLVLLIAVTAAFLLVMGGVSTFVLSKRLGGQFDGELLAAAQHKPQQIASNPGDYVAVEVTFPPLAVQPLTGTGAATEELADAVRSMIASHSARHFLGDHPFGVPRMDGGPRLRAVGVVLHGGGGDGGGGTHAGMFVARPIDAITDQVRGIVLTELITGGALILLLAVGGRWLIGRGLAPLGQMAGTAQRITTQGDLTARMPDDDDSTEVGRLGGAINTMLDRIQQAFGARLRSEQKVRQFAADASHELRTPLTTIRGYAELYRQGALGPDQLPNAMRRIEQEAERMSTLVAELLELARLDRTSSLDLAETDLAGLVRDAAADASAVTRRPGSTARASATASLARAARSVSVRSSDDSRSSRASSSSSATSLLIRSASCSMRRMAFGSSSGPSAPCRHSSASPRIVVSGVLSSWLASAANCRTFCSDARRAPKACWIRSSIVLMAPASRPVS